MPEVIHKWASILSSSTGLTPLSDANYYYVDFAASQLMAAISHAVANSDSLFQVPNPLITQSSLLAAHAALSEWETVLNDATEYNDFYFKGKIQLSIGALFHLFDEITQAKNTYQSIMLWGDSTLMQEASYWICHLEWMEQALQSDYDYTLFENVQPCEEYTASIGLLKTEIIRITPKVRTLLNEVNLYPNPLKETLTITISENDVYGYRFTILDLNGREVFPDIQMQSVKGTTKGQVNVAGLRSGTYMVKIQSPHGTEIRRVVVLH